MRWTFPAAIFLGACLLFLVQPMVAKALLPWFGGSAAVWTTCLVFFQVLLLAGYLYAHALATRVAPRRQAWVHGGLVALALAGLAVAALGFGSPAVPGPALAPQEVTGPVPRILVILALVIGLPYLVLAANGPLLQAWYARCFPGRSPYRLYALSNAGSLLGLLGYPFGLEPALELEAQGWLWMALFAGGLGTCQLLAARRSLRAAGPAPASAGPPPPPAAPGPAPGVRLGWLVLAAGSTGLLMAVSNQLGLDVAAVPFLWVLPLSVYLLTFVLCFERERLYVRWLCLLLWAALALAAGARIAGSTWAQVALQLGLLGTGCMLCHGELARAKPGPERLTSFYAYVALGGALGGALVGLAAPALLDGPWEHSLSLLWVSLVALG
ncbi:MAG TPA: ferrichrome ABC transporter permease, partial [Myxococcota bacterium]|nr:ferrichrome ABC transporter permease [Myxococcota bacterium]